MQHRQRGMTLIGIIVLVVVVGAWVYAGIRLTPKYLEYMRVAATLEKVRDEYDSNPGSTEFMLRKAVERHFDIEMVEVISSNDIEIT
jgi:Tfp pilus assembly protein PilE